MFFPFFLLLFELIRLWTTTLSISRTICNQDLNSWPVLKEGYCELSRHIEKKIGKHEVLSEFKED